MLRFTVCSDSQVHICPHLILAGWGDCVLKLVEVGGFVNLAEELESQDHT